jgi:UDP-N-acetylglucosamine--N-acetylmuramyl-(pentapeptide) pyrophosphoryl-undecaprenol N-acetylglucosamine transferase
MKKTIFIAGGGTGGHIYPGICIAKKLVADGICTPVFIVKKNDRGIKLLIELNYQYREIDVAGLPRKLNLQTVMFFIGLCVSMVQTVGFILNFRPVCSIGLGGYISFPVILLSRLFRIPTIVHEQNYVPGLANKILGKISTKTATSFAQTSQYFSIKKTVLTGNPVREELFTMTRVESCSWLNERYSAGFDHKKFTILVFGGSQGARYINNLIPQSIKSMNKYIDKIQVIHLTGENDYLSVRQKYDLVAGAHTLVLGYLEQIGYSYAASDIVICRAGATTVAELVYLRKPAILVPYPYATENHQYYNAVYLEKPGAAIVIKEKELTANYLTAKLTAFINEPALLANMQSAYKTLPVLNPSQVFSQTIYSLIG